MSTRSLAWEARDILKDLSPHLWDTRGLDALLLFNIRWQIDLPREDVEAALAEAITEESVANTARYQQYVASGGRYQPGGIDPETGLPTVKDNAPGSQAGGFVTGGRITGDQVILETQFGTVNTTTERILTFRLFQQDVLRSTCQLYESVYKKNHELNVKFWLPLLARVEKREDDDTLPINIFRHYVEEWFENAETEPERFESAIRNKNNVILRDGKEYVFSLDTIMNWLKIVDKERKWKKSEIKIYFQTIYGDRFDNDKRVFNCRVFSVMSTRPNLPPGRVIVSNPPAPLPHKEEVQHDSGSGEDDTTDLGRPSAPQTGSEPARDPDPVVQQSDGGGSQGPSAGEDDLPF